MMSARRRARRRRAVLGAVLGIAVIALLSATVLRETEPATTPREPGPPRFEDVTGRVGIPTSHTLSWGALFADFNRSGYPDLFVNRHLWRPWLFENRNGTRFELHDEDFYPKRVDRHNCAWGEADGDGRVDLYCLAGARHGRGRDPNQLYLQERDGDFRNRTRAYRVGYDRGRGRTMHWLDHDGDGDLDLVVTNARREGFPNVLFRNDGDVFTRTPVGIEERMPTAGSAWADWNRSGYPDLLVLRHGSESVVAYRNLGGSFRQVSLPGVTDLGGRWISAAWGDFDGDGWPDLHLVAHRRSVVLRNENGRRFEVVDDRRLRQGRMSVWLDVDNSGKLDLYVVQGAQSDDPDSVNHPNFMLVQRDDGSFRKVRHPSLRGPRAGNGDAVAAADFDRDGRVDLFLSNGHPPQRWRGPSVLLRNTTEALGWAGLELRGPPNNPWGMGARVRVRGTGVGYWRQVTDGVSGRAQSEVGYLHLGIAHSPQADVRVEWPDGATDCLTIPASSIERLERGSSPC